MFTREFMTQLKERGVVDEGHIININRYVYNYTMIKGSLIITPKVLSTIE